jgi:hypothetical protein
MFTLPASFFFFHQTISSWSVEKICINIALKNRTMTWYIDAE